MQSNLLGNVFTFSVLKSLIMVGTIPADIIKLNNNLRKINFFK